MDSSSFNGPDGARGVFPLTHYARVRLFRRIFSTPAHTLTENQIQFFK